MSNSIKFRYGILYVCNFYIIYIYIYEFLVFMCINIFKLSLRLRHYKYTEPTCKILKGSQQQVNTTTTVSIILIICKKRGRRLD